MGKGTDKLYITHSEWSSSDAYSANAGSNVNSERSQAHSFKRLPFNFCAASLQPFKHPVCSPDGTIFDVEAISEWLKKHTTNPTNGQPLRETELIKLNFARNGDAEAQSASGNDDRIVGEMVDPVTFKVFTDNTHIVAIRHGTEANVFAWDTIERLNINARMWRDLVDDREFGRSDIITLQDPQNVESRNLSQFKYLKDGGSLQILREADRAPVNKVKADAVGSLNQRALRAKEAVETARRRREEGGDLNRDRHSKQVVQQPTTKSSLIGDRPLAYNAAQHTTGKAAASFTSTGLTPETSGERALLTEEEYMLRPKRVSIKGYARVETNLGFFNVELHTETAPRAVWNFVQLAKKGYYKGVLFHRNIPSFMIQGGDPTGTGKGGSSVWGKNFQDEFDGPFSHDSRGIVSMANKGKNTNSSQFFITYGHAKHLDRKHTIFGRLVSGLDVLQRLENVPVDSANRPKSPIIMENIVIYVDPFEEFQKEKLEKEAAAFAREELQRQGGTDDDKTTWTGKRIRDHGSMALESNSSGVGKYLKSATKTKDHRSLEPLAAEEPMKKKAKSAAFGNFEDW